MIKTFTKRDALKIGAISGGSLLIAIALQSLGYAVTAGSPQPNPSRLRAKQYWE